MRCRKPQRARLRNSAARLYGRDPVFARRLAAYLPLFGLRWVLIMLNEFIPERWRRRVLAGDTEKLGRRQDAAACPRASEFLAALPERLED